MSLRENNYGDQEIYSKEKRQEYSTGLVRFPGQEFLNCFSPIPDELFMKLHGLRPGLPGKVISFHIVPLAPNYPARGGTGLAGHIPAKEKSCLRLVSPCNPPRGSSQICWISGLLRNGKPVIEFITKSILCRLFSNPSARSVNLQRKRIKEE